MVFRALVQEMERQGEGVHSHWAKLPFVKETLAHQIFDNHSSSHYSTINALHVSDAPNPVQPNNKDKNKFHRHTDRNLSAI